MTSTCYDDGDCFHKLAISGVFRFNDDDWADCFGHREYPPGPVMVLRSEIPLDVKAVPIEVMDESTTLSVRLELDQLDAFTHQAENGNPTKRLGQVRLSGRVAFGSPEELLKDWVSTWRDPIRKTPTVIDKAPFTRPAPNIIFDILDDTGFLLEQIRGDVSIHVPVDENGRRPSRTPRWLIDRSFDPDDYSANAKPSHSPNRKLAMLLRAVEQLQSTLAREHGQSRGMFTELAHIEGLLAETYRDRIQYEMLQNSDDAGATVVDVTVGSDGSVTWVNNGRPFTDAESPGTLRLTPGRERHSTGCISRRTKNTASRSY